MSKIPDKPGLWWWTPDTIDNADAMLVFEFATIVDGQETISLACKYFMPMPPITFELLGGHWLGPCYKPGESFTVGEIVRYFTAKTPYVGLKHISDKKHGIKAFTERNEEHG